MAYNKEYYDNRKKKLEQKFQQNKDRVLGKMTGFLNEFWEDQKEIQEQFKELDEIVKSKETKKVEEVKTKSGKTGKD